MNEELKPCPFCGNDNVIDADYGQEYWCVCSRCGCKTGKFGNRAAADDRWNTRTELAALKVVQGEAVEVMRFQLKHPFSGESKIVEVNRADVVEGMEDALFEKLGDLICQCESVGETNVVDCNCDDYIYDFDLVPDVVTAPPAPADAVSIAPGLERAIQIVREVVKTQPGYSDEREAIFEALSEAYVEAMAPPCTSAAVMSVSIGLLRNICSMVPEKMKPARKELRALLARSESKGVK